MPRLPAQWQSRKPRQPETVSSVRLKLHAPQPSEMSRPVGPPRPKQSKGNMATSCRVWRGKSSERRAEAKPTSSLPAKLLCTTAHQISRVLWPLPSTCLLGQMPLSPPFVLLQRASPVEEPPAPATPPTPVPKQSPRSKRWHPSPDPVESMPLGESTSKVNSRRTPQLQAVRDPFLGLSTSKLSHTGGIWPGF